MKSVQVKQYGGEEQLTMVDTARPEPGMKQVLVKIHATSFNAVDPKRVSGVMRQVFPLEFPFTPGGDFVGIVEAVGADVTEFKKGDAVFGYSMGGGAYAEYIATDASNVALKPERLGDAESAALALVAQTAIQMLDRAAVESGKTVLIHGAGGAVGSLATQMARLRGATVIATAAAKSAERVKANGASRVIDYATQAFEESVSGVDAVLDTVGGPVQARSYRVLKSGGALVAITQPPSAEEAAKYGVNASFMVTQVSTESLKTVARMANAGEIVPLIGRVYPLSEVGEAWKAARERAVEGKIVMTLG